MARTKEITNLSARRDRFGVLKLMAQADGYVMVRRPGCLPFVMSFSDWLKLDEAK